MVLDIMVVAKSIAPEVIKDGVAKLLDRYWERKKSEAFEELMEAVKYGEIGEIDAAFENDLAHAMWKYFCAARDGAARRNLRLIARAIVGLLGERRLFADDLDRYAPVLSRLTDVQILVMVRLNKAYRDALNEHGESGTANVTTRDAIVNGLQAELSYSADRIEGVLWELASMGLVLPFAGFGGQFYKPSELSREIIEKAKIG